MSSSVDGLVSGMSTSTVISQLIAVEKAPQDRLKSKVSTAQTAVAAYLSVNAKVNNLKSAGDAISQLSTWRGIKATSNNGTVNAAAVAGTNGAAGTTTFDVVALAKSQISSVKVPVTGDATSTGTFDVVIGPLSDPSKQTTKTVTLGADKSAKGIADAINAAGIGVKAAVVTTGGSENILQFSGTKTGESAAFQINGLGLTPTDVTTASNAKLQIGGGEGAGGYDVVGETNTFNNFMPGVSITVTKEGEKNVTINAVQDLDGIAAKFQALVDAANGTMTEIGKQTAYDASTNKGSTLTGDFSVRNMSQQILSSISKGLTYENPKFDSNLPEAPDNLKTIKFGSLSQLGVQLDSSGRLTFDATKFKANYADNPAGIQQAGIAFGDQMEAMSKTQDRNLQSVITGRKSEIDNLNSQIENWDVRLAAKKLALQKQYSDLEVSLGNLKNQSNWLAGQLSGLS